MDLGWKTLIPLALVEPRRHRDRRPGGRRGLADPRVDPPSASSLALVVVTRTRSRRPRARRAQRSRRRHAHELLDSVLLLDIFGGLRTTGEAPVPKKADTVEYPEQAKEPSDRFRGMFRLDEERCIKCTLCAIECPINIIFIDWHNEKNEAGKNEKVLDRFDLDLKRCMFCGLCEEACPTNPKSIWLTTKTYELGTYERNDALYLDIAQAHEVGRQRQAVHRSSRRGSRPEMDEPLHLLAVRRDRHVSGAVGVVAMRQPVHSALFLLLSFLGVAGLFVLAQRRVPRRRPDPRLRGRHHGSLPLHDHARERQARGRRAVRAHAGGAGLARGVPPPLVVGGTVVASSRVRGLSGAATCRPGPARDDVDHAHVTGVVDGEDHGDRHGQRDGNSQAVALGPLPRLPAAVRGRVGLPARRDDRRGRPRQADDGERATDDRPSRTTSRFSFVLFAIGVAGVLVRRNLLTVLMSIELMLNAANMNLIAFSRQLGDLNGQLFAVFVITLAAGEAAIGLAIIISLYRLKCSVNLDDAAEMKG